MATSKHLPSNDDAWRRQLPPEVVSWVENLRSLARSVAREARNNNGLVPGQEWRPNQGQEAKALDVSQGLYSRWCRAEVIPSEQRLESVFEHLGLDSTKRISYLVSRQNEVPPEQWTGRQAAFAVPVRDCS
jgi:transcriptional regulator with XRE-family HTH domain